MESSSKENDISSKSFLLHGCEPSGLSFASQAFLDNHSNFDKSGLSSKVLCFALAEDLASGKWEEFSPEVLEIFKKGFESKLTEVSVVVSGRSCIADFARMILVDLDVCCVRSIAWIDVENTCFFPKRAVDCACWGKQPNQVASQPEEREEEEPERFIPGVPDLNL